MMSAGLCLSHSERLPRADALLPATYARDLCILHLPRKPETTHYSDTAGLPGCRFNAIEEQIPGAGICSFDMKNFSGGECLSHEDLDIHNGWCIRQRHKCPGMRYAVDCYPGGSALNTVRIVYLYPEFGSTEFTYAAEMLEP